jgi:non-ribosomal peptide synthetase component E (peptide arylation enzyme)
VILVDALGRPSAAGVGGRSTLDDLFRRAVERRPDALALADPPNRESFTDRAPRQLSYAEADRVIWALAGRLRRMGLHTDSIVALQIANTVESALALLAVLRAGMIAMPLPLLWRRAEAIAAFGRVSANALIVSGRIGTRDHFESAQQIAAEVFPVRYVCGFGRNPPDGIIPLDDLYTIEKLDPVPPIDQERMLPPGPGAHLAVITWDTAPDGLIPVGRSHVELIAGGLAVLLESRLPQDATILTTLTLSSFAGIAIGLLPWLLVGGTLVLHHPFDQAALTDQYRSMAPDAAIVPGPLVAHFAEAGYFAAHTGLRHVLGVWRAPERLPRAPAWRNAEVGLTDIQVFGEAGLIPARRGPSGRPAVIAFGPVTAPRGAKGSIIVAEARPTASGTIALRGPMVPRHAFPPGVERTALPHFNVQANGFVDTGYACWGDQENSAMVVTGPPPGMVAVGGYRFIMRDLQDTIGEADAGATLAALPDSLVGHRLAGSAADRDAMQAALTQRGVNPLLADAFRDRRPVAGRETG